MIVRHSLLISYLVCSLVFQAWLVLGGSVCPATFQSIQNAVEQTTSFPCHMSSADQYSNNAEQEQSCPQTGHCQFCQFVALSFDTPALTTPQPMVKMTASLPHFYHFIASLPQRPPRFIA